jgi:hypothetical protein
MAMETTTAKTTIDKLNQISRIRAGGSADPMSRMPVTPVA